MCQCTPRRYSWRSSSLVVGILLVGRVNRNRNTALLPSQSQCAFVCLRVLLLLAGNFGQCFGLEVTLVYLGILCLSSEAFLMLMKERFGMVAGFCFLFGTELKFSCLRPPKLPPSMQYGLCPLLSGPDRRQSRTIAADLSIKAKISQVRKSQEA